MSILYNIVAKKNPFDPTASPKYYAVVNATGEVSQRDIAQEMALISTLSTPDCMAAMEGLLAIIPRMLAEGKIVRLGALGTFYSSVKSQGAISPEAFKRANVVVPHIRFKAGKEFLSVLRTAALKAKK